MMPEIPPRPDQIAGQVLHSGPDGLISSEFAIQIAREVWRLKSLVERNQEHAEFPIEALKVIVSRMEDALTLNSIEIHDPVRTKYDPGLRYEIADKEGDPNDELFVKLTLVPGVKIGGQVLALPTVVLSSEVF